MKKTPVLFVLLVTIPTVWAQKVQRYTNLEGQSQLCGAFPLEILASDTAFQTWFTKNYDAFKPLHRKHTWSKKLKNARVEIYMGTWCVDSKNWVPRFLKLWDEVGLKRDQLKFIALYDLPDRYRKGPHGEEKGKDIRKVPTFILIRGGKEIGRIVESPVRDLETDLAQIALGPSKK